jgi:hypothetical protein
MGKYTFLIAAFIVLYPFQEMGCGDMEWIVLAQESDRQRAHVNAVISIRVP